MILPSEGEALPQPMKMPNWYYDKKDLKNTPSIRDGLDFETDRRYRREGARFIMECGTKMGLGHNTMATGVVYFHRFYVFHSFKSFPRYVTACCCLFLAGKVEETPKKCRDIIKWARSMLDDQKFQSFGDDAKEEVMTLERILLQTIKFDLQVEHPYSYLVKYAKCLKGETKQVGKMVQMAWNFVNDSLSTTVCLQWEPEIIAVALIHLASKLSKFSVTKWDGQLPTHLRWWDMFVADVTMEILEDICHQVLDLYQEQNKKNAESPPQLPPSKSSPPAVKRAKVSPVYSKSSPTGGALLAATAAGPIGQAVQVIGAHQQQPPLPLLNQQLHQSQHPHHSHPLAAHAPLHHGKASTIDEKLQNMHQHRNNAGPPPPPMDSMAAYGAHHSYAPASAYGTMFQHAQFGQMQSTGQPPLPTHQQQPQPPGMYSGNAYGPPQQIPTHYQSGGGGGGDHGGHGGGGSQLPPQNYYQQPPLPGRGGYYQGPT